MKRFYSLFFTALVTSLSLALPPESHASLVSTWTMSNGSCTACNSYGNIRTFSGSQADSGNVNVSAWSDTGVNNALEDAKLKRWGNGLGVVNRSGNDSRVPDHAIDNKKNYDAVLFSFEKNVTLNEIVIGWWRDADLSVLAYTGTGTPSLEGQNYAGLDDPENGANGGWELVGNYFSPQDSRKSRGDLYFEINADNVSSSYWLISALNPAFNTPGCSGRALDCAPRNYLGNDYFKIYALSGIVNNDPPPTSQPVNAPGTAILLALGLPLLYWRRRSWRFQRAFKWA